MLVGNKNEALEVYVPLQVLQLFGFEVDVVSPGV